MVYRYICTHYCPLSHGPGADEAAQITDHAVVCVLTIIYINVSLHIVYVYMHTHLCGRGGTGRCTDHEIMRLYAY